MINIEPSETVWLSGFFSGENLLKWNDLAVERAPVAWQTQVLPWLEFLRKAPLECPIILPVFGTDGATRWYGLAENDRMAIQMLQEIKGFIGPSWSDYSGTFISSSTSDPIELVLRERFGTYIVRFEANSSADRKAIERQIALYQKLLVRRPPVINRGQRPFGRIRGDFDRALLAGNAVGAQEYLEELCESGRVTGEQRKFLDIRFLAGLGRYEELARNQALITSISELPLPPQTLVDVVEGLYKTFIAPIAETADIKFLLEAFKNNIAQRYGPIFRERKGIRHPELLLSFLLYEVSLSEPNLARCESLIQAYPSGMAGLSLAQRIFSSVSSHAPKKQPGAIEQARQAIVDEDYIATIGFCIEALPDLWAYKAMLRGAVEIDDIEIINRVLKKMGDADQVVLSSFSEKDRDRFSQVKKKTLDIHQVVHNRDWIDWAQWVLNDPQEGAPIKILENAFDSWNCGDYINSSEKCKELARLLGNADQKAGKVFRDTLPYLYKFFIESPPKPSQALTPIYIILQKIIGWSGVSTADELQLTCGITEALLATAPNQNDYDEALADLEEILSENEAPNNIDCFLNIAELLVMYPSSSSEGRLRLFMRIVTFVQSWGHRLTGAQRMIISMLATDYRCPDVIEGIPIAQQLELDEAKKSNFSGIVGIYTLSESSGQRAKLALKECLPSARVELNSDTVATDRLKSLAKNADIFVFSWKKSTHQAYYCVKDARGARGLVQPAGGGSASLIQAVLEKVSGPTIN